MGYIRNAILIEVPVEDVFRVTNNVRTWPQLFTEYQSSEVLDETGDTVTFRLTTHPDENNQQWSWIAKRHTLVDRKATYSERQPSSGPFERMVIRWWYDAVGLTSTVMTWEQEFTMKPDTPVTEEGATAYLNKQTHIQQRVIKERVESQFGVQEPHRGIIIGRYLKGSEDAIVEAFRRSDSTDLPKLLHVRSRHIWVLDDIYVHFVEGTALPSVIKDYAQHPLFLEVKAEVDQYVKALSPDFDPGVGKEIYSWRPETPGDAS